MSTGRADQPSDEKNPGAPGAGGQAVHESPDLRAVYTNFARVTGSPEEVILDFGLNPQPVGSPSIPVTISERLVMNYFTAKRLLGVLSMTVQRHEQAFGVLETDINKRVTAASQKASR
jgi:hypothetical protein